MIVLFNVKYDFFILLTMDKQTMYDCKIFSSFQTCFKVVKTLWVVVWIAGLGPEFRTSVVQGGFLYIAVP